MRLSKNRLILIGLLLGLPLICLVFFGVLGTHNFNTLPYYSSQGPSQPCEDKCFDAKRIGGFNLINQEGKPFSADDLQGKVWLAAFYGTDAPHCADFTKSLLSPNFRYRDEEDVAIVCFSLSPEHDTPEVLKPYVEVNSRYNGFDGKWQFLTGSESEINRVVEEEFMINDRDPNDPNNIATVWLVDTRGYLRGYYYPNQDLKGHSMKDAMEDIALLKKEIDLANYNRKQLAEELEGKKDLPFTFGADFRVPPFEFVGIDSVMVSDRSVAGQVKIVDYFFTRCPTICPKMSSQLVRTQSWLQEHGLDGDVTILSHSVDPEWDTPERLKEYAQMRNADLFSWKFLTGDKATLYAQAEQGYRLNAMVDSDAPGGFLHSNLFVLVDQLNRPRGIYDGTMTAEVDQLMMDAAQLVLFGDGAR